METEVVLFAKAIQEAISKFIEGHKTVPAPVVKKGEPAPVAKAEAQAEGEVEFYKPEAIEEMSEKEVVKVFTKELEIENMPKSLKGKKAVLTTLSRIINKVDDGPKSFSRDDLFLTADTIGAPHRKSSEDTIAGIREVLDAAAEDAPAEDGKAEEGEAEEPEAPAEGEEAASNKEVKDAEQKAYTEFVIEQIGDPKEFDEKEMLDQITAWVKRGAGTAEGKKIKADIAAKAKKDLPNAFVEFLTLMVGEDKDTGEKVLTEDDKPYVHGSLVFCNGLALEETDDENVGKDFASGKLFTLDENENIIEVKAKAPAKVGKKVILKKK